MNIKNKISNLKLGKKFKSEKNKLLKFLKIKKSEALGLASEQWIEKNNKGTEFHTLRNLVTINNQKYEFWIIQEEQDIINSGHINQQENWTIINLKSPPFKNAKNKNSVLYLSDKTWLTAKIIKKYYSQHFIKINDAITLFLKKTDLDELKTTLEAIQKETNKQTKNNEKSEK